MSVDFCDKSHQSEHTKYDAAWRWVHGHVRHIVVKSRMCIAYGLVCSIIINNRLSDGIAWFIDRNDRLTHTKLQCLLFLCLAGPGNFRPNFCVCSLSTSGEWNCPRKWGQCSSSSTTRKWKLKTKTAICHSIGVYKTVEVCIRTKGQPRPATTCIIITRWMWAKRSEGARCNEIRVHDHYFECTSLHCVCVFAVSVYVLCGRTVREKKVKFLFYVNLM